MSYRRRFLALGTAILVGAAVATEPAVPAGAVAGNPDWNGLVPTVCATGAIDAWSVVAPTREGDVTRVRLDGWIEPCPGAPAGQAAWSVVLYDATQGIHQGPMPYAVGQRTTFSMAVPSSSEWSAEVAVCLASAPGVRLACFAIATVGDQPVLTPAPASGPLVDNKPVTGPDSYGTPNCASCV